MQLEHVARWTHDLERLKVFYVDHFGATPSARYVNERRSFASYFLSLDAGARLEITTIVGLQAARAAHGAGYAHLAFAPGSSARASTARRRNCALRVAPFSARCAGRATATTKASSSTPMAIRSN